MQARALRQAVGELWRSADQMEHADDNLYRPKY